MAWALIKADEFDGNRIDDDLWMPTDWWGGNTNGEQSREYPCLFEVSNSTLKIYARDKEYDGLPYTAGRLSTYGRFDFQYGYQEIRCRFPLAGPGWWVSFWHLNHNADVPTGGKHYEIDTFEVLGDQPQILFTNYHVGDDSTVDYGDRSGGPTLPINDGKFHVIGTEWHPDSIRWYCDGALVFETGKTANADIAKALMYTWLDIKINGVWWGGLPVDDTTPFPVIWEIDYVRWYAQGGDLSVMGPGLGRPLPNPVPQPDYPPEFRFINAHASALEGSGGDTLTLTVDVVSPTDRSAMNIASEHKSWLYNYEYTGVTGALHDFKANVPLRVTFNDRFAGNAETKDWDKVCLFAGNLIPVLWVPGINMPAGHGGENLMPGGGYTGVGTLTGGTSPPPPLLSATVDHPSIAIARSGTGRVSTGPVTATAKDEVPPYTYAWTSRAGKASVIHADSPTAATTTFSGDLGALRTVTEIFDVDITDAAGHAVRQSVTVSLTAIHSTSAEPWSRQMRIPRRR